MVKTKKTKADRDAEKAFNQSYGRVGQNVQIDVLDMSKMKAEALTAFKTGTPMDDAVTASLAKYRKN